MDILNPVVLHISGKGLKRGSFQVAADISYDNTGEKAHFDNMYSHASNMYGKKHLNGPNRSKSNSNCG